MAMMTNQFSAPWGRMNTSMPPNLLEVMCVKNNPFPHNSESLGRWCVLLYQFQLSLPVEDGEEPQWLPLKSQPIQEAEAPVRTCCHCLHLSASHRDARPLYLESISPEQSHSTAIRSWTSHPALLALPRLSRGSSRKKGPLQVRNRLSPTPGHHQPGCLWPCLQFQGPTFVLICPFHTPTSHIQPFLRWIMYTARDLGVGPRALLPSLEQPNPLPLDLGAPFAPGIFTLHSPPSHPVHLTCNDFPSSPQQPT